MTGRLLPLLVAVPLLAAAVAVVVRSVPVQRVLAIGGPALTGSAGVLLVVEHRAEAVIANELGGYLPGVAIPFVSDTLTAVMLAVTGLTSSVCVWFLVRTGEDRYRFVPALTLMLTAGVNGALLTADLFNLFVFVEVMLLPSYALIAVTGTWRRLGIGRLFVVVNLLTSTVLLIGVGLVYGVAGTVNLGSLAGAAADDPWLGIAGGLVLTALAVKAGVAPAHGWLPRSYPATSAGIMGLFSAVHSKVAVYAIYRVYTVLYDGQAPWLPVLVALVALTAVVGAWSSLGESTVRRVLAFQMTTGVGHILLGLALFTQVGVAAGIFYLVHHVVTMAGLVLTSGAVEQTYGSGRLDRVHGLMRREPWVALLLGAGLFSLVGLPPSSGFFGKVGLVQAAAGSGGWSGTVLVVTVLLAAVATLLAAQRLWVMLCWGAPMTVHRPDSPATGRGQRTRLPDDVRIPWSLTLPGAVLLAASLSLFVLAGPAFAVADQAAASLLDVAAYARAVLR